MGILSDNFYDDLEKTPSQGQAQAAPSPAVLPASPAPAAPSQNPPITPAQANLNEAVAAIMPKDNVMLDQGEPVRLFGDVPQKVQERRSKLQTSLDRLPKEILSTVGLRLPDDETWNKMGFVDQAATVAKAGVLAAGRMFRDLPRATVRAPFSIAATTLAPWQALARGETGSLQELQSDKNQIELPWLGKVPTYFQSYDEAKKSGMGPLASGLMVSGIALGDATIVGSLGEAMASAFRPRGKALAPGVQIANTAPIQEAIDASVGTVKKAPGGVSEYYSLPRTVVKENYGTSPNSTFLKITPAGEGTVEVSVVNLRSGVVPKTVDYIKGKLGITEKRVTGDFGPEVKLESKVIKTSSPAAATDDAMKVAQQTGATADDLPFSSAAPTEQVPFIPPKALKGMENKPVTADQISTLDKIGQFNGIDPALKEAVIKTVTGKDIIGELTQAEYVKAAQTLGLFNNAAKYSGEVPGVNMFSQFVAPQRHFMRSIEESSGIPLYSEVYNKFETAFRARDVFRNSYRNEAREIFGDYAASTREAGEARRLVTSYMKGDKASVLENEALTPQMKADIVAMADKMRALYDRIGPAVGVPTDIYLKDYTPGVQDIGGIYQKYKAGSEIPESSSFFAKFKKKGNLQGAQIDDALALFDIYVNSGSNSVFIDPALKGISEFTKTLPENLKGSAKSYVLEKLGYAGRTEEFLDNLVPTINKKLGINLPPDTARQFTNLSLSTVYSGMLSSPATWFRQTFQYPLFGYARLGPKFSAEAITKGMTKEGFAEARAKGFLVDLGMPYGEELTKDTTLGGSALNVYRKATQKVVSPNSFVDNNIRSIVYHQAKMQWDDALSRYNSGKITWQQLEKDIDFKAFSTTDQNIIRQNLVKGDIESAFNHYAREIVDETSFPYRKAASSRITYGLGGKLGTSLLQWPVEAAYTMKRWATTGQWDKLIRFYAASATINNTMKDTFGFDFTRSLFNRATGGIIPNSLLGPAQNPYSPFVKTAIDSANAFSAFFNDNKEDFNKNKDSIVRTLKAVMPAGVLTQNARRFWRSYNAGPDQDGQYSALNDKSEVAYKTDFAGLFWGQLMGFPTEQKEGSSLLTTDIRNAQFDHTRAKQKVLELYQQEKFDEANEIIQATGVKLTPKDFDDYYVPLNQRTFQTLPAMLKAEFAPRVFPN